jgi:hypothetical protein
LSIKPSLEFHYNGLIIRFARWHRPRGIVLDYSA